MIANGAGKIVFTASLLSFQGGINVPGYAASKGAVASLIKAFANEWASKGITVNCIGPGRFHTPMTADILAGQDQYNRLIEVIPMGRLGEPDDLTGVSLLLASDASSYITGQTFYVDGGWLAGGGNIKG